MRKETNVDILKQHLKTLTRKFNLGFKWIFQMNSDPHHTFKLYSKWLKENKVNVLMWPSQSHNRCSIEHL